MRKINDELVKAFNTREHIELLNGFLNTDIKDDSLIDNVIINDKRFTIFKGKEQLVVQCEDGRILNLNINSVDRYTDSIYSPVTTINFDYFFDDNKLELVSVLRTKIKPGEKRTFSDEEMIDSSMYSIEGRYNNRGLIVKKFEDNEVKEGIVASIEVFDNSPKLFFFGNGTIMYNSVRLTNDGNTIIEYRGKQIPSRDKVFSYDVSEEKKKLLERLDSMSDGLSSITKEELKKSINGLDSRVKHIYELKDIYDQYVSETKQAITDAENFSMGVNHHIFTSDELKEVSSLLQKSNKVTEEKGNTLNKNNGNC